MNRQTKLITALTTAAKKSSNKAPLKVKIAKIKKKQALYEFLTR